MKTRKHHHIRIQTPLNSLWFALNQAGWDKVDRVVQNSNQARQRQRELNRKPVLNLIHA